MVPRPGTDRVAFLRGDCSSLEGQSTSTTRERFPDRQSTIRPSWIRAVTTRLPLLSPGVLILATRTWATTVLGLECEWTLGGTRLILALTFQSIYHCQSIGKFTTCCQGHGADKSPRPLRPLPAALTSTLCSGIALSTAPPTALMPELRARKVSLNRTPCTSRRHSPYRMYRRSSVLQYQRRT